MVAKRRNTFESSATSSTIPYAIKLPEMQLPTFDGTYEIWASFYDVFSSIIDRNENLTPVQKLQYLLSILTGMAAVCIGCLSTTDANYTDAIELTVEDNKVPPYTDLLEILEKRVNCVPEMNPRASSTASLVDGRTSDAKPGVLATRTF
ncbi:uncharacterized protein LOC143431086 [Xylocopa sonorina]|uniref:uncharacterized protein LOC143431086 n=1 Tax=Xylocopa sonorina TaxID=1818115 RepID=UPI00403AE8A1